MPRVTITVPDRNAQPYRFSLDRKSVALGRGSENDIVINCPSISVRHAVMERIEGGYQLRDLGSTNGTKFKGRTREKVALADGMTVQIGDVDFGFSLSPDEQEELARELPDGSPPVIREEAEEPPPRRERPKRAAVVPVASAKPPSPAASFFMMLLFFVLAALAFFIGLVIRYGSDNPGRSLVEDISKGIPAKEAPAGIQVE